MNKIKLKYFIIFLIIVVGTLGYLIITNSNKGYCTAGTISYDFDSDNEVLTVTGIKNDDTDAPTLSISDLKTQMDSQLTTLQAIYFIGDIKLPSDCSNMFYSQAADYSNKYKNLVSIVFDVNVDSSGVTNMSGMFKYCTGLYGIDAYNLDTSNVTDMSYMFAGCTILTCLDVSNFDTSSVINMANMFESCSSLSTIDLDFFNTSSVTNMNSMFRGCTGLTTLDISNFNTTSVTDMQYMIYGCSSIQSLNLNNFKVATSCNVSNFAKGCNSLTDIYINKDMESWPVNNNIFLVSGSISTNIHLPSGTATDSDLYKLASQYNATTNASGYDWYTDNITSNILTDAVDEKIEITVETTPKVKITVTGTKSTFGKIPVLKQINPLETQITNNKTTLQEVEFNGNIKCDDISFDYLFENCNILEKVTFGDDIDTSKVTNMSCMFMGCYALNTLEISKLNTSKVTNMGWMFCGCKALETLDVSNFDTRNVTKMYEMFYDCEELDSLDVRCFDTRNVTSMGYMFENCKDLDTLDLKGFDTKSVTNMGQMFYGCEELQSLDISNFDLSRVSSGSNVFGGCTALKLIHLPKNIGSFSNSISLPTFSSGEAWRGYARDGEVLKLLSSTTTYSKLIARDESNLATTVQYLKADIIIDISLCTLYDKDDNEITDGTLPDEEYTGREIKPVFKLKYNGTELIEDDDYTVRYSDNASCGQTCYVTITGKGNFKGEIYAYFYIHRSPIDYATNNVTLGVAPSISCTLTGDDTNGYTLDVVGTATDKNDLSTYPILSLDDFYWDYLNTYYDKIKNINFKGEIFYNDSYNYGYFLYYLTALESVTFSDNFYTGQSALMASMFAMDYNLKSIKLGKKFRFADGADVDGLFYDCYALETLDLSNLNVNNNTMTYYAKTFTNGRYDLGFASNCNSLTTIYFGNDWTSWGYGIDYDVSPTDHIVMNSKLFNVTTTEKLKTNIILPSDATDALVKLVSPYDSETGEGYKWDEDNRLVTIYKGSEIIYSDWIKENDDEENENGGSSNVIKETTITVGSSDSSSGNILNQSLNNTGYMKGYSVSNLFGSKTKKFKPNENITRAEIATIFTRIDSNYNASKDYSSVSLKYSDLETNKWYSNAVGFVTEKNIMKGYGDTFEADGYITRAELCSAICNYKNINLSVALSYNGNLTDIDNKWYTNYVKALSKMGYINGYKDGTFKGDEPITRAEACKVINKLLGIDTSKINKLNTYSDVSEGAWYYIDVINASMDE